MTRGKSLNKTIPSLYALKAICALGVVYLHVWYSNEYIFLFSKLAVPIFLAISGYFLFDPDTFISKDKIKRGIIKTLRLILEVDALYLLYYVVQYLLTGIFALNINSPIFFLTTVFVGGNLCPPAWYLNAYVEALLVLYLFLFVFKFRENTLRLIAVLAFVLSLVLGRYSVFVFNGYSFPKDWIFANFFTLGVPFVLLGAYINKYKTFLIENAFRISVFALMSFVAEIKLYQRTATYGGIGYTAITSFLMVIAVMTFCLKFEMGGGKLVDIGKRYSLPIYTLHYMCFMCFGQSQIPHSLLFVICVLMPILMSWLYNKLVMLFTHE